MTYVSDHYLMCVLDVPSRLERRLFVFLKYPSLGWARTQFTEGVQYILIKKR